MQFIYGDPLPPPYAATSVSVHAQVRHHLQIICVCRISVSELQNSRYRSFLHITRTSSVIWAESLPHMAIKSHFVAFPVSTFGTKRCSCTPVASWDTASLFVGTTASPWKSAGSRLCSLGISTFLTAGKTGFQELMLQKAATDLSKACNCVLHNFLENILWTSTSSYMH